MVDIRFEDGERWVRSESLDSRSRESGCSGPSGSSEIPPIDRRNKGPKDSRFSLGHTFALDLGAETHELAHALRSSREQTERLLTERNALRNELTNVSGERDGHVGWRTALDGGAGRCGVGD